MFFLLWPLTHNSFQTTELQSKELRPSAKKPGRRGPSLRPLDPLVQLVYPGTWLPGGRGLDRTTCWAIRCTERRHFLQLHSKGVRYRFFAPALRIPWQLLDTEAVSLPPLVPPKPLPRPLPWEEGISYQLLTLSLGLFFTGFTKQVNLSWRQGQ